MKAALSPKVRPLSPAHPTLPSPRSGAPRDHTDAPDQSTAPATEAMQPDPQVEVAPAKAVVRNDTLHGSLVVKSDLDTRLHAMQQRVRLSPFGSA